MRDLMAQGAQSAMENPIPTNPPAATVEAKLLTRLVEAYRNNPVGVAKACDEQIDRSGNLLGYLREAASLTTQAVEPDAWMYHSGNCREYWTKRLAPGDRFGTETPLYAAPPSPKTSEQDA